MEFKIYNNSCTVKVDETDEMKQLVFDRIIKFMKNYNCTCGETLQQSDDCNIDAPDVLSDIIDNIIKPITTHDDFIDEIG